MESSIVQMEDDVISNLMIKKTKNFNNKLHILVVEASPVARKSQSLILLKAGHSVVIAENDRGASFMWYAVEKCLTESVRPFDVITVSMFFGMMDGADAVQRLRRLGYVGLIFGVSGNLGSDESNRVLDSGADGMLLKPLDAESLIKAVKG